MIRMDHFNFNVFDLEKSLDFYKKAIEIDPENPTALNGMGYVLAYLLFQPDVFPQVPIRLPGSASDDPPAHNPVLLFRASCISETPGLRLLSQHGRNGSCHGKRFGGTARFPNRHSFCGGGQRFQVQRAGNGICSV